MTARSYQMSPQLQRRIQGAARRLRTTPEKVVERALSVYLFVVERPFARVIIQHHGKLWAPRFED